MTLTENQKTPVVDELLPFAEAAQRAVAGLVQAAEEHEREVAGLVRISSIPGIANYILARWSKAWLAAYPHLQIQIDAEVGYADLTLRQTDIAIRAHRPVSGDLVTVKWATSPSIITWCV